MKTKPPPVPPIVCVAGNLPDWVLSVVGDGRALSTSRVWFMYLGADLSWDLFNGRHPVPWARGGANDAVVVLYDKQPISAKVLQSWQQAIEGYPLRAFRVLTRPPWMTDGRTLDSWLNAEVSPLLHNENLLPEPEGLKLGQFVEMEPGVDHSDTETEFLTLSFGPMQKAVELLETHRRRYASTVRVNPKLREQFHEILDPAFAIKPIREPDPAPLAHEKYAAALAASRLSSVRPDSIPRILITGETGVGKTLLARTLTRSDNRDERLPFIRVSIPEFAGKEEDFESEMFGFRGGAYTNAPDDGSHGIFFSHVGGVVFLDEIGDATPTMQAKLLAYLDDFQVRPRGFLKTLFAPTLIIAATNYDLEEKVRSGDFRRDLLMRFPVQTEIPSLNERKAWFPLILDTLLQSEKVNPALAVRTIGQTALQALTRRDYKNGNFRMLENILTEAVEQARRQGRTFLHADDLPSNDPTRSP